MCVYWTEWYDSIVCFSDETFIKFQKRCLSILKRYPWIVCTTWATAAPLLCLPPCCDPRSSAVPAVSLAALQSEHVAQLNQKPTLSS